jgi:hypothetical protein
MGKRSVISVVALAAVCIGVYTQMTIFVVPPMAATTDGMILVFPRLSKTEFLDSPDGICQREAGMVNGLCRRVTLGVVASKARIVARLPYSETLYRMSAPAR